MLIYFSYKRLILIIHGKCVDEDDSSSIIFGVEWDGG
jgi:hypothetical protein